MKKLIGFFVWGGVLDSLKHPLVTPMQCNGSPVRMKL